MTGDAVHPIERRSYEILRSRVDLSHLPPLSRAVVERVVHASADLAWVDDLVLDEEALAGAAAALGDGAPVVVDSRMVGAGVRGRRVRVALAAEGLAGDADRWGTTRSAAGVRRAAATVGTGAVWVIGTAPTALAELLDHGADPALVVGLPVGFVGAVEAKQRLRGSGWPAISNTSEKGGAAVAAAALNAILRADPPRGDRP